MTSSLGDLKIYTTHPHSCSYLADEEAVTLFIDPQTDVDQELYSNLSRLGFRRSGPYLYRPHCETCQACIPTRIPVARFAATRTQRRCIKGNEDIDVCEISTIDTDEHYNLYANYIESRHHDGDMYPPQRDQYVSFLSNQWNSTRYFEYRHHGHLLAVAVSDELSDGLSAIYTFFDPAQNQRSPGSYAILWQIDYCLANEVPYLYLGYWIKNCQKMSYKTRYRPLELLVNNRWLELG